MTSVGKQKFKANDARASHEKGTVLHVVAVNGDIVPICEQGFVNKT